MVNLVVRHGWDELPPLLDDAKSPWMPSLSVRITKPYAYLTIGIMVANVIGAPLATGLLAMNGIGGLK